MKKLNLGCGPYKLENEGFINIDINSVWNPDIVRDVTKGLPFEDNSIDFINASHFFEHLIKDDMLFVLEECYRVLKPECILAVRIPIMNFEIDHKQVFSKDSLDVLYIPGEMRKYYRINMEWALIKKEFIPLTEKRYTVDSMIYEIRAIK